MIHSQRAREGWLSLNHRDSPGMSDEAMHAAGMPPGAGRGLFEAPTVTCSHCGTVVILHPLRTRERAYCAKCDHYLCDGCGRALAVSGVCRTFAELVAETQDQAAKAASLIVAP